jgi:hypothetical protein
MSGGNEDRTGGFWTVSTFGIDDDGVVLVDSVAALGRVTHERILNGLLFNPESDFNFKLVTHGKLEKSMLRGWDRELPGNQARMAAAPGRRASRRPDSDRPRG